MNEDLYLSSLRTVSSFDTGGGSQTLAVDVVPQDLKDFSPSSLFIESLIEQICSLVEKDSSNQRKLYLDVCRKLHKMNLIGESFKREEFQFMRSHYQKALYHLLTIAKSTSAENKALLPLSKRLAPHSSDSNPIEWSRYRTEFVELEYVAKGGFGSVYKAQHKLDGEIYAIKKIFLRYRSVGRFLQNLREVKMLAKLNHPNIVSYKAAWLETSNDKLPFTVDGSSSESPKSDITNQSNPDDSLEIVFEHSAKSGVKFEEESTVTRQSAVSSESSGTSNNFSTNSTGRVCKFERNFTFEIGNNYAPSQSAILFIQMQFCHKTLRQWLDIRNLDPVDIDTCPTMEIFKQIVQGVEYIHSQGIVHHDIKPSNIFISEDLRLVQVGDFGLACYLLTHPQSSLSVVTTHQKGQLGTKLYAAPEQLQGVCNAKSDVFSLGIVLFELVRPFCTSMERSKLISQLKSGHIPTELTANFNSSAKIISQTVVASLEKRPSSSQLLDTLSLTRSQTNEEQRRTIVELRLESKAKDEEIAFLKKQLNELAKRLSSMETMVRP